MGFVEGAGTVSAVCRMPKAEEDVPRSSKIS